MGAQRLPPRFAEGVRRFNLGEYFEAHEAFEELLDEVEDDSGRWELLLGLIQVAVGYHKAISGHPGAGRMLRLGAGKLAAFEPVAFGVAVGSLRARVADDLAAVDAGGSLAGRLDATRPRLEMDRR